MVVLAGLLTALLLSALDQTIVATALPTIVGELGGLSQLPYVVTAYMLASTATMPLLGKASDIFGRKIILQLSILVFLVGSLLCAIAPSMLALILARGVQGLGGGGLQALTFTLIGDLVPPRQRGRYTGYFTGVFAFSSVAGPLLGGFFVDHLSWRWVFLINLPVGAVAWLATAASLRRIQFARRPARLDLLGAALLVAGVSSLLMVTVWGGQDYEWGSPLVVGLIAASVAFVAAFVWWERRVTEPVLPLSVIRHPVVAIGVTISALLGAGLFGGTVFLPVFLQAVRGDSATLSGLQMLPMMAGVMTSSIITGRLVSRTGRYKPPPVIGCALAALGMLLLSRLQVDTPTWQTGGSMLLLGIGVGMTMPILSVAVQNAVPMRDLGSATASVNFMRSMGGSIGVAAFGAILTSRFNAQLRGKVPAGTDTGELVQSPERIQALEPALRADVTSALADGVSRVFLVGAPLIALCFILALLMPELPLRDDQPPADPEAAAV